MNMNRNMFTFGIVGAVMSLLIAITLDTTIFTTAYSQTSPTLGEPFYVEQTKSTGIRVLDVTHGPKIEVSFAGNGTINGTMNVMDIGTIWTFPTNNTSQNTLYSEGQGVLTTQQGEIVTYTQQATGQITPEGRVVFQGSMFFKALSPTGQLASLNNQMGIYNYESDLAGNAERQVWKWR
jgi:hypothetical protein